MGAASGFGPATPEDVDEIMAVERGPGFEALVGRWDRSEHLEEMAKPRSRYFVVREDGRIAGFAIVQGVQDPDAKAHLKRIAVREPGRGTGQRLLRDVLDWLFQETATNRLDLDVFADNAIARRAYEQAGFRAEGVLRDYHRAPDGSFRDMVMMSILRREWETRQN